MTRKEHNPVGAVLVQGAGIAGVQAALDLANTGLKVYLLEKSPAIGGMMAHLDKTFPTGDCATCIVSPKLVECARNLNVEIISLAELTKIAGEEGNFTTTIKKSPRYINEDVCNNCGECTTACPVEISDPFNKDLGTRKAVAKQYPQALPNLPNISKLGHSPCKIACPANINVQGYIQLIKKKEYVRAVNLIRERNPLSAICGRVCDHPCEAACTRSSVDSPVAIRQLKRFTSDQEMELVKSGEVALPKERKPAADATKVSVIGAGPAGITAAGDLADMGFDVTVYEALGAAGGMLRYGIPRYRLPTDILDYEIDLVRRKGVTFRYDQEVGRTVDINDLRQNSAAVFVATGVHKSRKLGIAGEDSSKVDFGVEFLRKVSKRGENPDVRDRVVVIGGGNVAVDCARTALRLGAKKVEMVSLEKMHEMPADKEEIDATIAEGIGINCGFGPKQIKEIASALKLELKRCTDVFDEQGRFAPKYDESDIQTIETDQIIVAIGQMMDERFCEHTGLEVVRGVFKVDPRTLVTSIDGIFAGGDTADGPGSVIQAVASGKRAAESIKRYINKENQHAPTFEDTVREIPQELRPDVVKQEKLDRSVSDEMAVSDRVSNFMEVEKAFTEEDAQYESTRCINCALCSECGECVVACDKNAVEHSMIPEEIELNVGSIILAPGFDEFKAEAKGEFGFGRYDNVITSVQFERMLSAAGPFEGHLVRLSDNQPAKRIAFIQCVGSRDSGCDNEYCSSICCMASTKEALVAKDHGEGVESTIFYMDMRAFGKGFDAYYEKANADESITYIKSMPSRIVEVPGSKDLRIKYFGSASEGLEKDFDLVVLSVGLDPTKSISKRISKLGIELNDYGFCKTDRLAPLSTSKKGVFVAGVFQEPKDIPETVTQASAAASMAMEALSEARGTLVNNKIYPPEHDTSDETPRIGVFVCHCGLNIASVVDVKKVVEVASNEPFVQFAQDSMFTCADESLGNIKEMIAEHRLNRVVVASCTPRTHEPLFRETLREAGLNQYLFELANIRDQCSWVHSNEPDAATTKACELTKMSIARAKSINPLVGSWLKVDQQGLVIGGGLCGMTSALSLADQGIPVHLVEKNKVLGGNMNHVFTTLENERIGEFTKGLIERVKHHSNINLLLENEIKTISGHIGKFEITVERNNKREDITAGSIIVATGASRAKTNEYLYGQSPGVITQVELEQSLADNTFSNDNQSVVMIQCVGSRNDEHEYCSRICCQMAIKNAMGIKKVAPNTQVVVLYRDIRTYGFREAYYKEARKEGVIFIRYEKEAPPEVSDNSGLQVTLDSPDFPETIQIEADRLVLSTGVSANTDNGRISNMLKVPLNSDGFYVEAHLKLRPVDFATEGIYLAGLAHSPKNMDENISQAKAAAARAATVLVKKELPVSAQVSIVDQNQCISCMTCVKACPYTAPFLNDNHKAEVKSAKCMGCGICVSECPARAIQLNHFKSLQFNDMIEIVEFCKSDNKAVKDPLIKNEESAQGKLQAKVN